VGSRHATVNLPHRRPVHSDRWLASCHSRVTRLAQIVSLRNPLSESSLAAFALGSACRRGAQLSDIERDDLQRYPDVTRAEMVLAKGVILVVGTAGQFLVPAFAEGIQDDENREIAART
jgi:hypothetical protein